MKQQQRPFSFSSYHFTNQAPPTQQIDLNHYINPKSEKAQKALLAHHQRDWRNYNRVEASYKTVMCQNWLEKAQCKFGKNCRFAHGSYDLRQPKLPPPINDKYKTRICDKYLHHGICPYGFRCLFIHPDTDGQLFLPPMPPGSPFIKYSKRPSVKSEFTQWPFNPVNEESPYSSSTSATQGFSVSLPFPLRAPPPTPLFPIKKWSDSDAEEMQRYVDNIVKSPFMK